MKIIAVSDSHGSTSELADIIKKHRRAEVVLFCGDGHSDLAAVRASFPDKMFYAVKGNCDWYCDFPLVEEVTLCGKKILLTHGHMHGVKEGYYRICAFGHSQNADIVVFGHTHKQLTTVDGNMLLMNPGSVGYRGSYSIIEINEKTGRITVTEYPNSEFGPVVLG